MEAKHTPGPWKVGPITWIDGIDGHAPTIEVSNEDYAVALVYLNDEELDTPGEGYATAALIAASPELAKWARVTCEQFEAQPSKDVVLVPWVAVEGLIAALAKAEAVQP